MPNIKQYTASGKESQRGASIPIGGPSTEDPGLEALSRASYHVAQGAEAAARVAGAIRAQNAETDYMFMKTQYDARIDAIHQDLAGDALVINAPETYENEFAKRARTAQQEILDSNKNKDASALFLGYFQGKYPGDLVNARKVGRDLQATHAVGRLVDLGGVLAERAVDVPVSQLGNLIAEYNEAVNNAYNRGFILAPKKEEMIANFEQKLLEKRMNALALGSSSDRELMRDLDRTGVFNKLDTTVRIKIHEAADNKEHKEEVRTEQVGKTAKEVIMNHNTSLALYGELDQSVIDDAMQNKNEYITPKEGAALNELNSKAPAGGNNSAIQWILSDLALQPGPVTRTKIEGAKKKLREMMLEAGRSSDDMEKASKHLESLTLQMRSVEAAELGNGIKYGENLYESTVPQGGIIPFIRERRRNLSVMDQAEFKRRLMESGDYSRENADKIMKDIIDRRTKQKENRSDDQKAVDKLLGR